MVKKKSHKTKLNFHKLCSPTQKSSGFSTWPMQDYSNSSIEYFCTLSSKDLPLKKNVSLTRQDITFHAHR